MAKTKHMFQPDYAVPPGATLKEALEERGLSQADLAIRTELTEKTISQIVNGIAPISYETAEKLEMAIGIPARFWNKRELSYREATARRNATQQLEHDVAWLSEIPVRVLKERGHIPPEVEKADLVRLVLKFFGVSSVDAWQGVWGSPAALYRGQAAQERKPGYVAAWLRIGEIQASSIEADPFDAGEFRRALDRVRSLSVTPASGWLTSIQKECAPAGVAVVLTKEIPIAGVSGATRWLSKDKALIQLSLKYKTDDHFWFTFFHEAGHILLHGKKQIFVEFGVGSGSTEEQEANKFSRDFLIPPVYERQLARLRTRLQIAEFAASLGIAPGIVVGRLQHDELVYHAAFTDLKHKLDWA